MTTPLQIRAAAGTHPGQIYELNQDKVYAAVRSSENGKTAGLFIVADGMGGHQAGEVASQLAVETIEQEFTWLLQPGDAEDTQPGHSNNDNAVAAVDAPVSQQLRQRVHAAVQEANRTITTYGEENPADAGNLGTTLTCVLIVDGTATIANVGDSRTYLVRDKQLKQITQDHSYVAQLIREGQIAPEDIYTHPRRNVITRSLGHRLDVEIDIWSEELQAGDRLLLCSDGLWEMVQEPAHILNTLLAADDPEDAVVSLITAANRNGGADNISVVVIHVDQS
jgi:protein phosphatase